MRSIRIKGTSFSIKRNTNTDYLTISRTSIHGKRQI
jgi:hypothetical protein